MSSPPKPPGCRLEAKYRLSPSFEIAGRRSIAAEFTFGPRLIGVDHSEYFWAREDAVAPTTSTMATLRIVTWCVDLFISGLLHWGASHGSRSLSLTETRERRETCSLMGCNPPAPGIAGD